MRLCDIFEIKNGIATSGLTVSPIPFEGSIPFLRPASTQQRTIAGFIHQSSVANSDIHPEESIVVSTNGEGSHSFSYVTRFRFAANSDVSVLVPKRPMGILEKVYYAKCITMNRWRFSYGRKPKGSRLKEIELPSIVPSWGRIDAGSLETSLQALHSDLEKCQSIVTNAKREELPTEREVPLEKLFEVTYGTNLELTRMERDNSGNGINFVSRSSRNNGVVAKVKKLKNVEPINGMVLTVAGGGSVLETFLQLSPFYSGRDLFYLTPKHPMSVEEMLFYCTCIRANAFRYSYGRQANSTLRNLLIPGLRHIPPSIYGSVRRVADECKRLIDRNITQ